MQELEEDGRVNVTIKPVCVFLFKDGGCDRDRMYTTDTSCHLVDRDRYLDPP